MFKVKNANEREQAKKQRFVAKYLKPLVANLDVGIVDVSYNFNGITEEVVLTYFNGQRVARDVSRDSLPQIVRDVLQGL